MTIYTGYGDQGYTRIVGGGRVMKNHPRVETYGSIDTLNSQLGVVIAQLPQTDPLREELLQVQQWIFNCSSDFATPQEKRPYFLGAEQPQWLEDKIDEYWQQTPAIQQFILPGGSLAASQLHVCRCFAREAERKAVGLLEQQEAVNAQALIFLNRLSDYFFALARWVNVQSGEPEIFYESSRKVFNQKRGFHVSHHDEADQ